MGQHNLPKPIDEMSLRELTDALQKFLPANSPTQVVIRIKHTAGQLADSAIIWEVMNKAVAAKYGDASQTAVRVGLDETLTDDFDITFT